MLQTQQASQAEHIHQGLSTTNIGTTALL